MPLPQNKIWLLILLLSLTSLAVFCSFSWNLNMYSVGPQKPSDCACQKCLTDGDPAFKALIASAPKPFLSTKFSVSEGDFNWWKRLQSESRSFTFFNATVGNLFKIFPPIPDVVGPSPNHCRTCAVVGNSGNLKGSHYGPLIDLHDIVIRMNHGQTKGYESDAGTKTTHHIMYPESYVNLANTTHLVLFPFKIRDLEWLLWTFKPGEQVNKVANKDRVMILNPAFIKYVHERWMKNKGSYPSTGFLTLALSLLICDEVSVFGFGADKDGNWSHYFEILRNKNLRTGPHAGVQEYEVIEQLRKTQKIQVFKGW